MSIFKKLFHAVFGPEKLLVPEPVGNLKRVKSNVKITWTPSVTGGVISQKILVINKVGIKLIEKDLDPDAPAFSFSAMKGMTVTVTVAPFNGEVYGEAQSITFEV